MDKIIKIYTRIQMQDKISQIIFLFFFQKISLWYVFYTSLVNKFKLRNGL